MCGARPFRSQFRCSPMVFGPPHLSHSAWHPLLCPRAHARLVLCFYAGVCLASKSVGSSLAVCGVWAVFLPRSVFLHAAWLGLRPCLPNGQACSADPAGPSPFFVVHPWHPPFAASSDVPARSSGLPAFLTPPGTYFPAHVLMQDCPCVSTLMSALLQRV